MTGAAVLLAAALGAAVTPADLGHADALRDAFEAASARLENWDVPGARRAAEELLARFGRGPVTDELVGRVRFFEGDYAGAVERLAEDSPYRKLAEAALAEMKDTDEYTSAHFRLRVPKGPDQVLVPYALDTLERAYAAVGGDLGEHPPEKIRVEILRQVSALARLSPLTEAQLEESGTIAICKYDKLMVTSPDDLVAGYPWQDTLAHELTHYLILRRNGNSVPVWIHEGIAKFEESRWRGPPGVALSPTAASCLAERSRAGRFVPFGKIAPSMALLSAEDATAAFAEVFDAVKWLYETRGGTAAIDALLDKLRAGETDRQAVADVAGESFEAFEGDWKAFIRRQSVPPDVPPACRLDLHFKDPKPTVRREEADPEEFGGKIDDRAARTAAHLGELLRARGRPAAAAYEYAKAAAVVGARLPLFSNRYAEALMSIGQDDRAEALLKSSLHPFPESAETHLHLGQIFLSTRRWKEARDELLRSNAVNPFDPAVHQDLAQAYQQLGDADARAAELRALALLGR